MIPRTPAARLTLLTLALSLGPNPGLAQSTPAQPGTAQTEPAQAPIQAPLGALRSSVVSVTILSPGRSSALLVAQRPPDGSRYLPGSSRLDGMPLPDPLVGPSGRLYWTLPGNGMLSYELTHTGPLNALGTPALLALDPQGRDERLSGELDAADRVAARPLPPERTRAENPGGLKLPLDGAVYRDRDQVTVVAEGPADQPLDARLNGEVLPRGLIGRRVFDPATGRQRLEYVGVRLRPGENRLSAGMDEVSVTLAGATQRVTAEPLQTVADGVTPIRLRVRALDERGVTTALPFVTLRSTPEPSLPDANPAQAGYQLRLTDGEGVLVLPPQATPSRVSVAADLGDGRPQVSRITLRPGRTRIGVGLLSVTLSPATSGGTPFNVALSGRASLETPLGEGRLSVAADSAGLPVSRDADVGYAVYGDQSREVLPLQGQDRVAAQYDHPEFSVAYRQAPVPVQTVSVPGAPTALSFISHTPLTVSAFAALVPIDTRQEVLTPDGTRLLRLLRSGVAADSETVDLLLTDPQTRAVTVRRLLRGSDYVLDAPSGLLTLAAPLSRLDAALNDVTLQVAYRLDGSGVRVPMGGGELRGSVGAFGISAAVVSLPENVTTAARLSYDTQPVQGSLLTAYSQGVLIDASVRASLGGTSASAAVHHQEATYAGLNAGGIGTYATATLGAPLTTRLTASGSADYRATPAGTTGSVAGTLDYVQAPFSVGAGLRATLGVSGPSTTGLGTTAPSETTPGGGGLSATGRFGYHAAPLDLDLTHAQPLGGAGPAVSTVSARVALAGGVALIARDELRWGVGHRATLGLESRQGTTNYAVTYELPTADGAGNRARFGADTTLPLGDRLSLNLSGAYLYPLGGGGELNASSTLRYQAATSSASASADVSLKNGALRTVLRGGAALSLSNTLTISADALSEFGPTRGDRFSVGAALRDGPWQGLATVRYSAGSLATGAPTLLGQTDLEYHQPRYAVRLGLAARQRLDDPLSMTWQPGAGATWYPTDWLGLGASVRASLQPGTSSAQYGAGLEGSLRALPGAWVTLGYNLLGFESLNSAITRRGAYLRLDLTLDEQYLLEKK